MDKEVTSKELEEELVELDKEDVYEDESEESNEPADDSQEATEEARAVEGEADDEKEAGEKEETSEEASGEASTSESKVVGEEEKGDGESEAPETVDDQQRITSLMTEIDRLSGLLVTKASESPEVKEPKDKKGKTKTEDGLEDFVGDLDMDDVASDPTVLNSILNKVLQKGIETGKQMGADQSKASTASIDQIVLSQVENAMTTKNMIDKFYDANPELSNVKQVVRACASQIVSEHPEKSFEDVLTLAAKTARKTLGISKSMGKSKISDSSDVPFAEQKGGQRKPMKKVSKLQQELDEL